MNKVQILEALNVLEEQGVSIEVKVSNSGIINVSLGGTRPINVTVNGKSSVAEVTGHKAKYWQPDGSQGDTPPMDLRGG